MPKNVMKLIKPSPHRARNDFDLSHRHVLSQNMGELIPATCIETVPGDYIELSVANLMRAIPMVTSPFLRVKQHIDVWFVPYRDLWHNFDNFITQKEQPVSSALKYYQYAPHTSIYNLYNNVKYDNSFTDVVGRDPNITSKKLLHYLGYADSTHAPSSNPASVNLFRLAAYNYIWYNEYRQQYYDNGLRGLASGADNPAVLFNFDDLLCNSLGTADLNYLGNWQYRVQAMCQMRYRCWKKDLFTGLLPSTQFGGISTLTTFNDLSRPIFENQNGSQPTSGVVLTAAASSGRLVQSSAASDGNIPSTWNSNALFLSEKSVTSSVDILALRRSEAVQIWRENALRAGNRVADNMMAHYGVESDFKDHRPTFIGSADAPLNIGDVMTTSNSDFSGNTNPNTNVGDIAGKGTSTFNDNRFKFKANDFGVIMAIHSILPEAEYNAYGIDRMNQLLESEDFFIPEYENLGLEAVSSLNWVSIPTNVAKVVGYAPRYYGYKQKLDLCFGPFTTGHMFAPWCAPKYDVTTHLSSPTVMPLACLYVNPAIFDINFNVGIVNSDQFLNDLYFDVDAVRPMSVVGLPFS